MPGTVRPCARDAQLFLARIDADALSESGVQIDVIDHDVFRSFVKSKVAVDEDRRLVTVHQFVTERDEASGQPTQIRIKVKTGEALNAHFTMPDGAPLAAEHDRTGAELIRSWVDRAVAASSNPAAPAIAGALVIDCDSMAATGRDWVPAFATLRVDNGVVHLQSRSMLVLRSQPLPEGFTPPPGILGVHYVANPTPELIADLVDGRASHPV